MLRDNWLKWFERRIQLGRISSRRRRSGKRIEARAACIAEALEQRTLLTTFTVDNLTDESDGDFSAGDQSLREAIQRANANPGADIVNFAPGLGGSVINLTLGNLTVNDDLSIVGFNNPVIVNNGGLVLQASGPTDTLVFSMTGLAVNNNVLGPGLSVESINDGFVTANISNSFFNNSAREGIKVLTHTGGVANLTLNDVDVNSNGDTIASAGIAVEVGVSAQAESLSPGTFATVRLNMTDVEVRNNKLEGLDVNVATGGIFETTTPITDTIFAGNGVASARNEVDLTVDGLDSSIEARFENVTANNSQANGFNAVATAGANVALVINNSSATGAGSDALNVLATGPDSSATVSVNTFNGDNAGVYGADIDSTAGAEVRVNNFNNVSLQNAGRSGLDVFLLGGDLTAFNSTTLNVSGNTENGANLFLRDGSSVFTFNDLTANNNVLRGVQVTSIVNANTNVTINNISAQGNLTKQPLNFVVNNNATLNLDVNGGTISSAGTDPNNSIFGVVAQNSTGNLSFDGLTVNNSTSSAFVTRYDSGSDGTYEITNTTATGSQAVGAALFVKNGADVTANFDGLDVSNSGQGITADGVRIDVNGLGTTANLSLNNVTADGVSKRGIGIQYANKASGSVTQFDGISAQNAQQDGVVIEARGLSTLTSFTGNGVNVSGAGQSGNIAHDGIEINLLGSSVPGTTASVSIDNLTANNAAGRGINVSAQNRVVADVVIDGFSANNNGLQGLNLVVGTITNGAVLQNSAFMNGTANNNGTAGMFDGIRTRVTGGGTSADVNFSNVAASNNSLSGQDVLVNGNADLTFGFEAGSTANNNFLGGLRFLAQGAATTAALTSTVGGNAFDGNNENGAFVQLTGGVTVSDLTILGGASDNNENGIHIDADDMSGVTINNFFVGGTGATFANNDETGLLVDMEGVLGMSDFVVDGVTASGNLGVATGVSIVLVDMMLANVEATNITAFGNTGDGLRLTLDDVDISEDLTFTGFNTSTNMEDGAELVLLNGTTVADTLSLSGSSNNNAGDGLKVTANDASGVSIGTLDVTGASLNVNDNSGNGLTVDFDTVAGITSFDLSNMVITGNEGDQVKATFANMVDPIAINFNDALATGPGGGGGTGDGIDLTLDNTVATTLELDRINASNNNGDGLKLSLLGALTTIPATSIDVGTFDSNGANGINLVMTDSTASIDITNSTFDLLGTIASASNNGANGMLVQLDNATLTMDEVNQIIFDANGEAGIDIQGATPSTFDSGSSFTNNTITNNGSFGFRGVFNGGTFDISLGSRTTAGQGNLIDNNTGAGVSLDMIQDSMGRFTVIDNTITNTNDDGDPFTDFTGAGIFVRMLGTANPAQATNTLTSGGVDPGLLIRDNKIGVDAADMAAGNDGTGINFRVEELSVIDGLHVHDNRVDNSGVDGLNFIRLDEVAVNGFEILRSTFNDSGDDGVEIFGQNDDSSTMFVAILESEMMRNGNDGAAFGVLAEAGINLDMDDNMIVQNGDDGVQITEVILDLSDGRNVSGSVDRNVIAENGNRGVNVSGRTQGLGFTDNTIGMLRDQFDQIVYLGNGSTGVELNASGSSSWTTNDVRANGRLVMADRTIGHGFDIQNAGSKDVTMTDNQIRENSQDGIEFHNNRDSRFSFTLTMIDNRVQGNLGRGLDVLNQAFSTGVTNFRDARSFITIYRGTTGNTFNSNGEEGIYVVNTSSSTQNQTDFSGTALLQDGSVERDPQLSLIIDHATISNNGSPANVPNMLASAGVMVRVGSSDGRGGLTTSTANQPIDDQFATFDFSYAGDVAGPLTPAFRSGGVFMGLTSSSLHGNFGDDVFIHGYRSTDDPPGVTGTWSDTMFQITNTSTYGDPLSRIDLEWRSNDFDSLDLNNSLFRGTPDGEAGAYYDNSDGAFKSRLGNATPPGPFANNAAGRRRNAQRAPARTYDGGFTLSPSIGQVLSANDGYGSSTASIGDINGDGVADVAIGAPGIAGGSSGGAVFIQFLNDDGTINSTTEISGGLNGGPILATADLFGSSIAALGDLDGDGIGDVAVGAAGDDTGGADRGAVYVLFLNADGTVKSSVKIDDGTANAPTLADGDAFGSALSAIPPVTPGITPATLAVGASGDDTGGTDRGAIYTLTINPDGTVAVGTTKIADSTNGGPALADGDLFGTSVTAIGDLNGDTFMDWAVGAIGDDSGGINQGAVYILFMNGAGTVGSIQEISEGNGGGPTLFPSDFFGTSVTRLTDLDGDLVDDLVVGAPGINVGGPDRGGVFVLLMNTNGTVKSVVRSADGDPNVPMLDDGDMFGSGVVSIGDLDADGVDDLAIGARGDDTQANNGGAAYIVFMNADGTIKSTEKIGSSAPGDSTPDLGRFLYPGMGESTFRVTGFGFGGFILDDSPFTSQFSANGIGFTGATLSGERPFGWGSY